MFFAQSFGAMEIKKSSIIGIMVLPMIKVKKL